MRELMARGIQRSRKRRKTEEPTPEDPESTTKQKECPPANDKMGVPGSGDTSDTGITSANNYLFFF